MSGVDVRDEDVKAALQRVLAWPEIARSPQLARFLDYIVTRKLAGESDAIKAYSIAVDVLGRSSDFDPQTDPIVRVQARRLRGLLDQYYRDAGANDPLRIHLPTGRYVPDFEPQTVQPEAIVEPDPLPPSEPPPPGRSRFTTQWFALALLTLAFAVIVLGISEWFGRQETTVIAARDVVDRPVVAVTEFQSLTGDPADVSIVAGLAVELVTDLEQFETIDTLYGSAEAGAMASADYTLSGIVRREGGMLQYSAILTETGSGNVVWNKAIAVEGADLVRPDLLDVVSGNLSSVLGSPRGPLHAKARALLESVGDIVGLETPYLCRVLFDLYRERSTTGAGERAQQCYSALSEADRATGPVLAARGSLSVEGILSQTTREMEPTERIAHAETLLKQAIAAAPLSSFVWEQRGRTHELVGQHEAAESAYSSAQQLNPANTDVMAARARHLAFMGRQELARDLAFHAIAAGPQAPPWYFGVPAIDALSRLDYGKAAGYAETYAEADRELGPILAVMAGQGLGDVAIVNGYLPRILDLASFRSRGILTRLRLRTVDEALLRDIRQSLLAAGVPADALNAAF